MRISRFNYLGLLSLLALIPILGWKLEIPGLFGFFGFAYYLRYFWVTPDELFLLNLRKAATAAFFWELISLVPLLAAAWVICGGTRALPAALGLSYAVAILVFSFALAALELREQRSADHD